MRADAQTVVPIVGAFAAMVWHLNFELITLGLVLKLVGVAVPLYVAYVCTFFRSHASDLDGKPLPGPAAKTLFGNFAELRVRPGQAFEDRISDSFIDMQKNHGSDQGLVCFRPIGSLLFAVVSSAEGCKDVLQSSYTAYPKGLPYLNMRYALGLGLVTANGARFCAKAHEFWI